MDQDDRHLSQPESVHKNLDDQSIAAIGDYIDALKQEIKRAEAVVQTKKAARTGAEAVFK